jgi:hypothetical protein
MVGVVPAPGQLNNLVGTYHVFASTAPMSVNTATDISTLAGSANSTTGSLAFSFLTGAYNFNLTVNTIGETYFLAGSGSALNISDPRFATSGTITSAGATCTYGCTPAIQGVNLVQGAFFGKNGERAGLQYGFYIPGSSIWGTTALKK